MSNHLVDSSSPYLLQHAQNPVDWYPWGSEALQKARTENKPIFLSIGYAACHWCHVMAHESFEDPETAAVMNENFVSIKVDREERPDLDNIYMSATQALTGSGGWPMSVFLTPDLRPFYAGTYFPSVRRYNLPSFKELLLSLANAWHEQAGEVEGVATRVVQHLESTTSTRHQQAMLTESELAVICKDLVDSYDWGYGGWGSAPKFPQPMLIEFLLRRTATGQDPGGGALRTALHALKAMARGGMYDVVGGGFSRYSTDNFWRVPHFEKMLYDNALLARAYLHAWRITGDAFFKRIAASTLEFVEREMRHPDGGFYSSLDADTEGQEGKFYVWTQDQVRTAIKDGADFKLFAAAYGLTQRGNWEGRTVLQRSLDDASLAAQFKISDKDISMILARCHRKLLEERSGRVRPATDDKVLTAWNGLMLRTFADTARLIGDKTLAERYRQIAVDNASYLLKTLYRDGRLFRSWRLDQAGPVAFLEDHGALICGLLALYEADLDERWYHSAVEIASLMIDRFEDPDGGFFDTDSSAESLLIRPKNLSDNATPSGNALACEALLRLAALTDDGEYRDRAFRAIAAVAEPARSFPMAFGYWLSTADLASGRVQQVAVVFPQYVTSAQALLDVINAEYRPNMVLAAGRYPPANSAPALLQERPLREGKPAAYVCEQFVCKLPVTDPDELKQQLD
ncbi:MAG TPA: thioredoxin domain-containing protein [Anaerolineales bacterium]|nr:thioredoxin domain-containing protein [Anaerolineales bacterium]